MKIGLFSGSFPNGWHFCKLPHSQSHKLAREKRGRHWSGGPLPPPQQIKTIEFQFSRWTHFQEDPKVIQIWSPSRKPNNHNRFKKYSEIGPSKRLESICRSKKEMWVLILGKQVVPIKKRGICKKMLIAVKTSCCPPTWEFSELGKAREKFEEKFKKRLKKSSRKNWRKV